MSLEFVEIARRRNGVVVTVGSRAPRIDGTGATQWDSISTMESYLPGEGDGWWPAGAPLPAIVQAITGNALDGVFDAAFLHATGVAVQLVLQRHLVRSLAQALANSVEKD